MDRRTTIPALIACLAISGSAAAQGFVPFDQPPAKKPATQPPAKAAPAKKKEKTKKKEAAKSKATGAKKAPAPAATPTPAPAATSPAPAPTTPPPATAAPAPSGAAPPVVVPPAAPSTGAPGAGAPTRKVLGEKLVSKKVEPYGASAMAPATAGRPIDAPENDRPSPGLDGAVGLPHLHVARTGPVGSVRLSMIGEVFTMKDFLVQGDQDSRQGLTFAVGWTPKRWLEAYASIAFASNTNTLSAPQLLQVQGDTALGVKGIWQASDAFALAADLRFSVYPSIGSIGYGAVGLTPRALLTFDARKLNPKIPLLAHLDLGGIFDGTGSLPGSVQLDRVEEFALGIHQYNRFELGLGLESPLPYVTAFVAWRMHAPLGNVTLPQVRDEKGNLRQLTYGEVISHVLAVGARLTAFRDVSIMLDVDIGLNGAAVPGVPATMPWNILGGVSYTFDPASSSEKVTRTMEKTIEITKPVAVAPPTGFVSGLVHDAKTGKPVSGVMLTVVGGTEGPVASADTGRFRTHDLKPGKVEIVASRDGYKSQTLSTDVVVGKPAKLDFDLVKKITNGILALSIVDGRHHRPIAAQVTIKGPKQDVLTAGKDGKLSTKLPPGKYTVDISARHYLTRQKDLTIEDGGKIVADVELARRHRRLVIFRKNKIELRRKIHFLSGKSDILPDSFQILDQVIDLIARHNIQKLRIEGHTDSRGPAAYNMRLSQARADAVRTYLIEKGISPDRIVAKGYGETRPIAPNLTKRGRAMNRRVEFHVVAD